jgi:hypothetical protein
MYPVSITQAAGRYETRPELGAQKTMPLLWSGIDNHLIQSTADYSNAVPG